MGAYAGFKLLPPAGPLLIAAGLGVDAAAPGCALTGLALLLPVVAAGLLWVRLAAPADRDDPAPAPAPAPDPASLFKLVNGSSLATFAAVPAVFAPLVAASGLDRTGAAYAICLGSFLAVAPNDSFFWVSQLGGAAADGSARGRPLDLSIAGASVAQGLAGFLLLGGWLAATGRLG